MRKNPVFALIIMIYFLGSTPAITLAQSGKEKAPALGGKTSIPGYVTHGVNVFNDQFLVDYSDASPQVPSLMVPIYEIGVPNETEDASDADVITADTDPSLPVATIRSFGDFFNPETLPGENFDPALFNQTLDQIGSNAFGYTRLDDRVLRVPFNEAVPGDVYQGANTNPRPTVEEWNAASGLMRFQCGADGSATVEVAVRNAFPNGVYTLWDIGALYPLTDKEEGYAVPFGGLPNILLTDSNGCGYIQVEVPFCPNRPCEAGADSCTSYISAFYHWDHQVYGGAPAGTFMGVPVGAIGSNHLVWPMSGTPLQEVQNPFPPPHGKLSCQGQTGR
jgi:hypothetical protein